MLWFNEKKAKSVNFVEDDAPLARGCGGRAVGRR
jgi:hypothetical protein